MHTTVKDAQLATAIESDPRWASVVARDAQADGTFYSSVKTTGGYCCPSCAARRARPEHVQFHVTCKDAEKAGFRPCKRCQPNQPALAEQYASVVAEACRFMADAEEAPDLETLANHAGISRYHFHRIFKAVTGLTPHDYLVAKRTQSVYKQLAKSDTVTQAMYDAGSRSRGHFYETTNELLEMTPSRFRAGGARTDIRFAIGECSLGSLLVARSDRGVCAIRLNLRYGVSRVRSGHRYTVGIIFHDAKEGEGNVRESL